MQEKLQRFFFYTYGAFGLGHLRRVLHIARGLSNRGHPASILVATNSSQSRVVNLPAGCSLLPLPPLIRDIFDKEPNKYRSLAPGLSAKGAFELRAQAIRCVLDSFRPDLVFVDHGPTGAERELVPLLEAVEERKGADKPRLVLGLRDIYGQVAWTRRDWRRLGAEEVLPLYDLILVFGDPKVTTTAQELDLDAKLPGKVYHTGYLGRRIESEHGYQTKQQAPVVMVTPGGGNDGQPFLEEIATFLESRSGTNGVRFQVVTGPFLPRKALRDLKNRYLGADPSIHLMTSTRRMEQMFAKASGVISMAGYNTMVETLSARKPALVVPRQSPSEEQVLRASRLCPVAGLFCSLPGEPVVSAISSFVDYIRSEPGNLEGVEPDMAGLGRTLTLINSLR